MLKSNYKTSGNYGESLLHIKGKMCLDAFVIKK